MIGELLHIIFARYLLGFIALIVIGLFVGAGIKSNGVKITIWIIMLVFVFLSVISSGTMANYDHMNRAGLISGSDFNFLAFGSTAFLMTTYSLMQWFGSSSRVYAKEQVGEEIDAMTNDELLEAIELTLSMTDVCIVPWVQNKWSMKSDEEKSNWVELYYDDLKAYAKEHGGFDEIHRTPFARSEFVVEVQRLDRIKSDNISLANV